MTLRDEFAKSFPMTLMEFLLSYGETEITTKSLKLYAIASYNYADVMLQIREKI